MVCDSGAVVILCKRREGGAGLQMQDRQELTNRRIGSVHRVSADEVGAPINIYCGARPTDASRRRPRDLYDRPAPPTGSMYEWPRDHVGTDGRHEALQEPGRRQVGGRRDGTEWRRRRYRDRERDACQLPVPRDVLSIAVPHAGRSGGPNARWSAAANLCRTVETCQPSSHGHAFERVFGEIVRLQPVTVATGSVSRVGERHSGLAEPTGWSAISRVARPSTTDCSVPTRAAGATFRPAGAVITGREAAGK